MKTCIIEATNHSNWGKFLVGVWDKRERSHQSVISRSRKNPARPLLAQLGWDLENTILVQDLATGEGALFSHGGVAKADLDKHQIWVCPLFEPFLTWLYEQPKEIVLELDLPLVVELPHAPLELQGYRRTGVPPAES